MGVRGKETPRGYALTESVGTGVAVLESLVAAGAAGFSPPWPRGAATITLDEVVEIPRSRSTSLTVRLVVLAITDGLPPWWAIWANWERCTVSSIS